MWKTAGVTSRPTVRRHVEDAAVVKPVSGSRRAVAA